MAKVTKIKASDPKLPKEQQKPAEKPEVKEVKTTEKTSKKSDKKAKKADKKPFVLFRPFCAIGRYFRDSWREIRQVRWPSRKATWKMVLAVFIYSAIFLAFILLLDSLFTFLFNLILS